MAGISEFLSVMTPGVAGSHVVVTLSTSNQATPLSVSAASIPTGAGLTEKQIAQAIAAGINTMLIANSIQYQGVPYFTQDGPSPFTFRTWVTDHIINVWSQGPFAIEIASSDPTMIVLCKSHPVYPTVADADQLAPMFNVKLSQNGVPFTDPQIALACSVASAEIVSYLGGYPGIGSQMIMTEFGFDTDACFTDYTPVISWDNAVIRGPSLVGTPDANTVQITSNVQIEWDTGAVNFTSWGFVPYIFRPLDKDNVLMMTYVAGLNKVHDIFKQEAMRLAGFLSVPMHFTSIKSNSMSVNLRGRDDVEQTVRGNLGRLFP